MKKIKKKKERNNNQGIIISILIIGLIIFFVIRFSNTEVPSGPDEAVQQPMEVPTSPTKVLPQPMEIPVSQTETTKPLVGVQVDLPSNAEKNQKLMLELINPLIDKYSFLVESIETQLPYWEGLNQTYTSTITNLQGLQSVNWRNDVDGVITQLLYEKDLSSKYIDLAKARQGYANGMKEGYTSAYAEFGLEPFDDKFRKTVNDGISEMNGYISEYDINNLDGVTQTLKKRFENMNVVVKALFERLQNSQ